MSVASEAWTLALGALPVGDGIRMRNATEVRFFPAAERTLCEQLCDIPALDAFLASDVARTPRVSLADARREGSAGVPHEDFTSGDEGHIDPPRLFALYDGGATLVCSQMHEVHPPLARFCRGLELVFLHAVQ